MTFPKQIMSVSEMVALGYSRTEANALCHRQGQTYAFKTHGGGKWLIDTEELRKWQEIHGTGSMRNS